MNTRILVVDDELDTLNLLRTILEISGYTPITTLNSVDAIGLAEVEKPDVILLDIMMPKLDGFTLCKMMRQHTTTKDLPIIFVTAYESLDIEQRRVETLLAGPGPPQQCAGGFQDSRFKSKLYGV